MTTDTVSLGLARTVLNTAAIWRVYLAQTYELLNRVKVVPGNVMPGRGAMEKFGVRW